MVIFVFWIAAMGLTLLALGLLLPPLLRSHGPARHRRAIERELATLKRRLEAAQIDEATYAAERERLSTALLAAVETPATAPARALAVTLALALPVAALALYLALGRPEALDPARVAANAPQDMETALAGLEARLRERPDDVQGWLLLARSYRAVARFDDMRRATTSAFALDPSSPDVMVEHAEAITLNSPSRRFEGEARQLLESALAADGNHQKSLWLLGVAELQSGRPAQAVGYWERLRALLPPGDPVAARIDEQIAAARAQAGGGMPAPGVAAAPTMPPAGGAGDSGSDATGEGPHVQVTVMLADALRERLAPGDTLFVFARAPAGGPPLAIRRIASPAFPVTATLSAADRMIEGMQLVEGAEVSIGARISKSGQATPQPGDLQATPVTLTLDATNTLTLHIDDLVE